MSDFNIGSDWKTKVSKGSIRENEYVQVSKNGDWETYCTVKTEDGREEEYLKSELNGFGFLKYNKKVFDIVEDHYTDHSTDKYGNKDVLIGLGHLTDKVRTGETIFKFWEDCLYTNLHGNFFKYNYTELTDNEVIDILLNDILYGIEPGLQSTSCVGTTKKGIDNDPNYHDGHYTLCNNKEYTMTYCGSTVKIREGKDGGWYSGTKDVGRTIYEGKVDWEKIKLATIKQGAVYMLNKGYNLFTEFPEIEKILTEHIKNDDKYKLSHEFETEK